MADDNTRRRPRPEPDPEIASADLLFREDPVRKQARPPQKPGAAAGTGPGAGDVFDLVEGTAPGDETATPVVPVPTGPAGVETRKPSAARTERAKSEREPDPAKLVQEVWSRKAEWGPNLLVVGAWSAFILLFVYYVLGVEHFGLSFFVLILGALVAGVLSYPMLITLERPVRVTPEQAVRDYYGALSHHLPHFRRMWLLLSSAGRVSTAYGSFTGFKRYWRERLAGLRQGHASSFTPLVFEIVEFNAEKSAGKTRIDADFTLKVFVRGRRQSGAIHSVPMRISLARGPDNMWYLDNGTLNRSERAATARSTP